MKYSDALLIPPSLSSGKEKSPLASFMERCEWSQLPLQHYWNFGYHSHTIMKIMNSLPWRVTTPFKRLCDVLHGVAEENSSRIKKTSLIDRNRDGAYEKFEAPLISDTWDDEKDYGLILMDFDPELQTRDEVNANKRASHFWGLTKDDLTDRFEKNQVPLQMTELDWVRVFSVYLSRYFSDDVTQYLRFTLGQGHASRCSLVCMTTSKAFNQFGKISQARPVPIW